MAMAMAMSESATGKGVDSLWTYFKDLCRRLESATSDTMRRDQVRDIQGFLTDEQHRFYIHKWRGWSLLFPSLLAAIKKDAGAYLRARGIDTGSRVKRKSTPTLTQSAMSKIKLTNWSYLRAEFAAAHAADKPMLHLDANGRACITQLITFAIAVINREFASNSEEERVIGAQVEAEAWQTIQMIVQYRVYCAVLEKSNFQDILELGLAAVDHDNVGIDSYTSSDLLVHATVMHHVIKNCPFDLYEWMPKLLPFFGEWFDRLDTRSRDRFSDAAPKILEAVTALCRAYMPSVGAFILTERGLPILHYVRRSWKVIAYRLRVHLAAYVVLFVEVYELNRDSLPLINGSAAPKYLMREAKALVDVMLDTKQMQQALAMLRVQRGGWSAAAVTGGGSSGVSGSSTANSGLLELDAQAIAFLSCAADVVYFHDRVLVSLVDDVSASVTSVNDGCDDRSTGYHGNVKSEGDLNLQSASPSHSSSTKRSRDVLSPMAWEKLLDIVHQGLDGSTVPQTVFTRSSQVASPFTQSSTQQEKPGSPFAKNLQHSRAKAAQRPQLVRFLLLLLSVLRRHGTYYAEERIGDLLSMMPDLTRILVVKASTKTVDTLQIIALHMLIQLASLPRIHNVVYRDDFRDSWEDIWQLIIRPELPYISSAAAICNSNNSVDRETGFLGESIVVLLSCCLGLRLVSRSVVASSEEALLGLFCHHHSDRPSITPNGATDLPAASGGSGVGGIVSSAPITFLMILLQFTQPQDTVPIRTEKPHMLDSTIADASITVDVRGESEIDDVVEESHLSTRLRLIDALFRHLQSGALVDENRSRRDGQEASGHTPWSEGDAAIHPLLYASSYALLLGGGSRYNITILGGKRDPGLLQQLSQNLSSTSNDAVEETDEMDGFGVHFTLEESGLRDLADSVGLTGDFGKRPNLFPPIIEEIRLRHRFNRSDQAHDRFQRLGVPPGLLMWGVVDDADATALIEVENNSSESVTTISTEARKSSSMRLIAHFSATISKLAKDLCAVDTTSLHRTLVVLNASMPMGITVAGLFAELYGGRRAGTVGNLDNVKLELLDLLKTFLTLLSDHFTATSIARARSSIHAARLATRLIVRFHNIILILQDHNRLGAMEHPSTDSVNLYIPPELRVPIRKIVATVETSLELVMKPGNGDIDVGDNDFKYSTDELSAGSTSSSNARASGGDKSANLNWERLLTQNTTPPSTSQSQPAGYTRTRAELDDNAFKLSLQVLKVQHVQKVLSLWSLRLILLLKKESGLKVVRSQARNLQLSPDFLLGAAALVSSVPGSDSLKLTIKLIDSAVKLSKYGDDDDRVVARAIKLRDGDTRRVNDTLFECEVLRLLTLVAHSHEARTVKTKEGLPEVLVTMVQAFLPQMESRRFQQDIRGARIIEAIALEVLFRLNPDKFLDNFLSVVMENLGDRDMQVRVKSAQALQSVFYMHPDGCAQIFRYISPSVLQLFPSTIATAHGAQVDPSSQTVEVLSMPACSTAILALYVSGCSSQEVIPEVLSLFVSLARCQDAPVYSTTSLLSRWLWFIAQHYGYPNIARLMDDHFCYVWSQYAAGQPFIARDVGVAEASRLFDEFPARTLLVVDGQSDFNDGGKDSSALDVKVTMLYRRNSDVIKALAVLYDAVVERKTDGAHGEVGGAQMFPLVNGLATILSQESSNRTECDAGQQIWLLSADEEEQITTDLFALSFVLQASQKSSLDTDEGNTVAQMLTLAEDRAMAHQALSLSHLCHVVIKMARFVVWKIAAASGGAEQDSDSIVETNVWQRAMQSMKEKYSGFDWSSINLVELLWAYHEIILRCSFDEEAAARSIDCFCLLVDEIRGSLNKKPHLAQLAVLQHLILHISFQAIKMVMATRHRCGSSSPSVSVGSTHRLTSLLRSLCAEFIHNTNCFGKYLNVVVREISGLLSCSHIEASTHWSSIPGQFAFSPRVQPCDLDGDDRANLEWIVCAVRDNMTSGLDKYLLNVDIVLAHGSPSLEKLNALIASSSKSALRQDEDKTVPSKVTGSSDMSHLQAIEHIEQFIRHTYGDHGKAFYRPRRSRLTDSSVQGNKSMSDPALVARIKGIQGSVRTLCASCQIGNEDATNTLGKLVRVLFNVGVSYPDRGISSRSCKYRENLTSIPHAAHTAAATILGEVGAWDPHILSLSPGHNSNELSRLYQQHFWRGALHEIKSTFVSQMHERVLFNLCGIVFDDSETRPEVMHTALVAIKRILRVGDVAVMLEKSRDAELRKFLEPFLTASPPDGILSPSRTSSHTNNTTEQRQTRLHRSLSSLWTSHKKRGFRNWVCSLTARLADLCTDPVLRACSSVARDRLDWATFLFPYVLWTVLKCPQKAKGEMTSIAKVVISSVNGGIRALVGSYSSTSSSSPSPGSAPDSRVLQLIVHAINFLRETEKTMFVESNGRINSNDSSATTAASKRSSSGSTVSQPVKTGIAVELNAPAYTCVVDVNLLDIAAAALRVSMPYSAMQYVEMWLEHQHGGVLPSLASAPSTVSSLASPTSLVSMLDRARSILIEAYSFDDDVDGLYGVNDGRSLASQLVVYNREGAYAQALPLYDVALQFAKSTRAPEVGLVHALSRLGYQHMLRGHLDALSVTSNAQPTSLTPQLDEYRYELAWKSLQWDTGAADTTGVSVSSQMSSRLHTPAVDVEGGAYLHHRTLCQQLESLLHGNMDHVVYNSAISRARILESLQLSLRGLESTKDMFETLLRLQSIQKIEACAFELNRARQDGRDQNNLEPKPTASMLSKLFEPWRQSHDYDTRADQSFESTENLLSLEEALVRVSALTSCTALDTRKLAGIHLALSRVSRKSDRIAITYGAQQKLQELHARGALPFLEQMQWQMEKAKLLWKQHETRSAIWVAQSVQSELATHLQPEKLLAHQLDPAIVPCLQRLQVSSLVTIGKWIASQRSESSQVIIEKYLQLAADIADATLANANEGGDPSGSNADCARAHLALARYLEDMYHQVLTRVTSREWIARKRVADARNRELQECLAMAPNQQEANRAHIHALNREVQYDFQERSRVEASVDEFLVGAMRSYGTTLAQSPRSERAVVFRVVSLWFSNQLKPSVSRTIQEMVHHVPSYKFVPLSYQIISRIGSSVTASSSATTVATDTNAEIVFQRVLCEMVLKLCEEHPHHALIQLLALKNSGDVEGKGALEFRTNIGAAKSHGAQRYVDKLRRGSQRELLESLDMLANAYIQLALFDTRAYHKQNKKIALAEVSIVLSTSSTSSSASLPRVPFDQCLRDRSRLSSRSRRESQGSGVLPTVLTSHLAPRADLDYTNVARLLSFDPSFSITDSGIHRPKIIYCFGSDGKRYKQLVKGQDDTRQDLVIEQVFDTVNHFLTEEPATQRRQLRLCTYKVVPLSPIAGVLEWVDNTIPWGSYLVGRSGKRLSAHERYHPREWKHTECRMRLKNATAKLATYREIEAHFTPVFHHFFLEKYPDAAMWYKRRLAFVQSAAVTSIVGYILGIGDRHSQNILIHERTAELVHIDFGVVFDQGMTLFTPETVPFRLTRELVDGMGVAGVHGVFTRCCEATLQLLRKKSASVMTILEVFVHDPLYRWTLSPLKALRIQEEGLHNDRANNTTNVSSRRSVGGAMRRRDALDDDAESSLIPAAGSGGSGDSTTDAATRALIRVKQKLEGYEDPNGSALSIEGQVKHLISTAQDPHNLCALFPGWAPWL